MALGSLIGAAFVRISADTSPGEKAIKSLGSVGSQALGVALLPVANVAAVGVGAIAAAFTAAGVAAVAFGAAVKPQITDVTSAATQYAAVQAAQAKAELAAQQAHKLATSSNVAYENALTAASAAQQREQQASIQRSREYAGIQDAQTKASNASAAASVLAAKGGTAYESAKNAAARAAASANQESAQNATAQAAANARAAAATATANALASKGGTAYENALSAAAAAHASAQALAASSADQYHDAQTAAGQASLNAQQLATSGGKAYVAALAKVKAANQAVATAQDTYNQTLAGMPPATRATATAYIGLTSAVTKWSDSLAGSTMPVFTLGIEKIQGLLPKAAPIVREVGADLLSFLENIDSGTGGKVFDRFGTDIGGIASGSLSGALAIVRNIAVGSVGILDSFVPMSSKVTGGVARLSGRFADWGSTAGSGSGFQGFMDRARKDAPQLASDLEKLATAAVHIAGGAGPLSGLGLKIAEALADIVSAVPVPVLNQVANLIVATNIAMKAYALYTSIAAAATWLFSTANGASRASMALLYGQMVLVWVQLKLQAIWTALVTAATWLWNTSLVSGTVGLITSTAALVARNAVLLASAVATGIMTAATWLWTAALSPAIAAVWAMTAALLASPITWIVLAVGLLIAGIVLIATKTTWFQTAWTRSWTLLRTTATTVWSWLSTALSAIGTAATWLWSGVLRPFLRTLLDGFLASILVVLKAAADALGWVPLVGSGLKKALADVEKFRDAVNASLGGLSPKTVPVAIKFNGVPEGTVSGHTYTSTTGFTYKDGGGVGPGGEPIRDGGDPGRYVADGTADSRPGAALRLLRGTVSRPAPGQQPFAVPDMVLPDMVLPALALPALALPALALARIQVLVRLAVTAAALRRARAATVVLAASGAGRSRLAAAGTAAGAAAPTGVATGRSRRLAAVPAGASAAMPAANGVDRWLTSVPPRSGARSGRPVPAAARAAGPVPVGRTVDITWTITGVIQSQAQFQRAFLDALDAAGVA